MSSTKELSHDDSRTTTEQWPSEPVEICGRLNITLLGLTLGQIDLRLNIATTGRMTVPTLDVRLSNDSA